MKGWRQWGGEEVVSKHLGYSSQLNGDIRIISYLVDSVDKIYLTNNN